ncbi:hypothetical protein [Seonamhaeicola sp.]|uniref:hypothetical protein n=1 Tax=Seonamhaeicola sp. TaxID=1912245 RepID=UPI003561F3A9
MKKLTLILIIVLFGCRTKKSTTSETNEKLIDTVYINTKSIDTVRITELKEVTKPIYIEQEIPCNENQKGTVKSGNNSINYEVKDGYVQFKAEIDSCYSYYKELFESSLKDSISAIRKIHEKELIETENKKIYVTPFWVWVVVAAGVVILILYLKEKTSIFSKIISIFTP